jgi:5-methylcytosine-specific restriction protein A
MPLSAPHPCGAPGCPALVRGRARCAEHERKRERERGTSTERGYDARWRRARLAYLRQHPLCVLCAPRVVPATVVDHRQPHRGDERLFWAEDNWQPLCKSCHDRKTATEDGGFGR